MGPAPVGATKRNFFLPMTAMFGRWCQQLVHKSPLMSNCTWESENGPAKFFLGASLTVSLTGGSFDLFQPADGTWKSVIRRVRYKLMGREVLSSRWLVMEFQPLSPVGDQPEEGYTHRKLCRMLSLSLSALVNSSSCERVQVLISLSGGLLLGVMVGTSGNVDCVRHARERFVSHYFVGINVYLTVLAYSMIQGGPSAPLEPPRGPMSNLSERSAKTPVL